MFTQRIRCLFIRQYVGDDWDLLSVMTEGEWEGGWKDFEKVPANYQSREVWVNIEDTAIQVALSTPTWKEK